MGWTERLPEISVPHHILVMGTPMSVDTVPAVPLEHMVAYRTNTIANGRGVVLTRHTEGLRMDRRILLSHDVSQPLPASSDSFAF